jgi:hypothetical protein
MISWVTRPPAKIKGGNDTWSNSLMSQQGPVSERRRAFFFGRVPLFRTAPLEEADPNEVVWLVAETAS